MVLRAALASLHLKKHVGKLEMVLRMATEAIKGMEQLLHEGWLKRLRLFALGRRELTVEQNLTEMYRLPAIPM